LTNEGFYFQPQPFKVADMHVILDAVYPREDCLGTLDEAPLGGEEEAFVASL